MADVFLLNRKSFGAAISLPLGVFFMIFMAQFNLVRGWVFATMHDDSLLINLGGQDPDWLVTRALCWTALFIMSFGAAYRYARIPHGLMRWGDAMVIFQATDPDTITRNRSAVLLLSFLVTIGCACFIVAFSLIAGGSDLSSRVSSAYVYMLPLVIYSICLSLYGAVLNTSRDGKFMWIVALLCLFAVISYFGRTVSTFRIYSITLPALIVGYHLARKKRLLLCAVGMALVFPLITHMGKNRTADNRDLAASLATSLSAEASGGIDDFLLGPYKAAGGDFTTVDIFASVLKQEPGFYPYGLSWAYALVHFIPRQLWEGKPENGILYDTSYSMVNRGGQEVSIPYTPGVVGDAYLEGGGAFIFLIGAMFGCAFKGLDLILGRRKMLFGPTIDYCAIYSAFLFVAFFANRSLPYFIVLYTIINVAGVYLGRLVIRIAVGFSSGGANPQRRNLANLRQIRPIIQAKPRPAAGQLPEV